MLGLGFALTGISRGLETETTRVGAMHSRQLDPRGPTFFEKIELGFLTRSVYPLKDEEFS